MQIAEGRITFPQGMANALAEHEAKLVLGTRVRVARIGECAQVWHEDSPCGRLKHIGHHIEEQGITGSIDEFLTSDIVGYDPLHIFSIRLDVPVRHSGHDHVYYFEHFAAIELEIIDDTTDVRQ
jgi:hypothetical protein